MRRVAPAVLPLVAIAVLAVAMTGCVTVNRVPADPTPTPTATPASTPTTAPAASPAGSPASDGAVVDPTLLRHLPASVDGFALAPDPTTAANVAADPTLSANAEAIAMAIVVAPGSTGDDLAVASVVRLRPGVDNPIFRSIFRAAYDRVACEQAGGVAGSESATIAGRDVLVGSCTGGATTYHVHLGDGLLVSVTSLGPRGLGEQIVANLQE